MAPPAPIDQESVFYNGSWTMEVETLFVEKLVNEVLFGCYRVGASNNAAIRLAMKDVNQKFQTEFTYKFCFGKHRSLKHRYHVSNWIVNLSGIGHNPKTNRVHCSDDAWEFICEKEKLARVYIEKGEPLFEEMKCLFQSGPDPVEGDELVPVIQISSDHEEDDHEEDKQIILGQVRDTNITDNDWWNDVALGYQDEAFEDEVTQPSANSSPKRDTGKLKMPTNSGENVNRRLWPDEGSSTASFSPLKKK